MSAASPSFACRPRWFAAACAALVAFGAGPAPACTTAVIAGKATADGRPLLWKSRDLRSLPANEAVVYQAGGRRVLAVVNVGNRDAVWMGVNSSGFCIENSLSLDLADAGQRRGPSNGGIMKEALETCGTVEDFRALLERSDDTGRRTVGNFGVIDARGGAALFEVGPRSFRMFDANDPQVAPHGYIVRSNFATTAKGMPPAPDAAAIEPSYSTERYARACRLLDNVPGGSVSVGYLLRHVCRDLADGRGRAVAGSVNGPAGDMPETVRTASTISRTTTVSVAVFHGVKPGEDPLLTTMWVALGDPKFSIAVPCWAAVEELTDAVGGQHGGAIGSIATTLRAWTLTPDGDGVYTEHLRQVWDDVWPVEDRLLATVAAMRDRQRTAPVDPAELTELHRHLSAHALDAMRGELVDMKQAALSLPAPPPPDFAPSP